MSVVAFPKQRGAQAMPMSRGVRGAKGDPGGNAMAIGLFADAGALSIPAGTDMVRTAGHSEGGKGVADYVYDATVDATYAAANPRASFMSANGRGFRLDTSKGVNLHQLGAVGDGVANDTSAVAAAKKLLSQGAWVRVPDGIFVTDPEQLKFVGGADSPRILLTGNGATSVLKLRDGSVTADNKRMIQVGSAASGQDFDFIELRDLVIDMNARANPLVDPGNAFSLQHCHALTIAPNSGTIKQVRVSNVVVKDPIADGFNCAHTGTAAVENYVISNCAVIDRDRVRSDVVFATFPVASEITGFYGDVIEAEAEAAVASPVKIHISNCRVNRLDIATHTDDFPTGFVEVYLDNVSASERAYFAGLMLRASNCSLGVQINTNYSRWWCFQPGSQFSDCLFLHEYDGAAVGQLTPMTSGTYSWRTNVRFVGCEFRINDSGSAITPTGAAILGTAGVTPATMDNTSLEVVGCRFDKRFATSVFANQCGRVRLANNDYGGKTAAVKYQSGAAAAVDLLVEGGDFRRVTGAMIGTSAATVDQVAGIGYLRLSGAHVGSAAPWVSISGALPTTANNQLQSNRRLLLAATPAKGILGDIVEISPPVAGAIDSYRCTVSPATSGGSATWKARTTLAA